MYKHKNLFIYNNYNEFALDSYNYIKGNDIIAFIDAIFEVIYWLRLEIIWRKLNVNFISNEEYTESGDTKGSVTITYNNGEEIITSLPTIPDADRIVSMNNFLKNYSYIENINLDTINLTSIRSAFANSNLHNIVLNTHKVTDYTSAFENCSLNDIVIDFNSVTNIGNISSLFNGVSFNNIEILNGNENLYILNNCQGINFKYLAGQVYFGVNNVNANNINAKSVKIRQYNKSSNINCDDVYIDGINFTVLNTILNINAKNIIIDSSYSIRFIVNFELSILQSINIKNDFINGAVISNLNLDTLDNTIFNLSKDYLNVNNIFQINTVNNDLVNKFNFLPLYCISSLDNSKGADINLDLSNTEYIINAPYCYKFADNAYIKGKIKNIIAPSDNITSYNIINTYTLEEYNGYNAPVLNNYYDDISPICRINGLFKLKETDEPKYYSYTELSCFQNIDNSINTYIGNIGYNYINNQAENYFITNKIKLFFSNYNDIRFFNDTNNIGNINLYNYIIYNTENTKTVFSFNNKNDIINIDNLLNFAITGAISNSIFVSSSTNKTININDKIVLFNNNGIYVSIPENYYIVNHFIGDVDLYLRKYKSSYSNIIIDGTITIINGNETENVENNITDITCNSLIIEDNCPIKYLINISEESINNLMNALITNTDTLKTINIYRIQYNKITEENISNVLNKNYQFAIEEN